MTSASSAAAPRPRKPRSTRSSGSSRGRAAASRPPRTLTAQPGRPGALRSLPMLSAPRLARRAARRARPLADAGPRTRIGNLRRSLAPRPAGARQTSRSLSPPETLRSPQQIPTPEEKPAGQVRARGAGPRGRWPAGAASRGVPQPRSPGPGSRKLAQLLSLCLAQRSGRPVPRRPLRAQLPLSMPGAGCCPERAPPARGLCSPRAHPGPGPRAVPGGGAGSRSEQVSEPGSRRPTSPASSAQLWALPALLLARCS